MTPVFSASRGAAWLALLLVFTLLAGCGEDEAPPTPTPALEGAPAVSAMGAWVRATPGDGAGQMTGAYLTLNNTGVQVERLVSVRAEGAGVVEMHQTTRQGEVMQMAPVDQIEVPAGDSLALEPGGLHLMLFDLTGPLSPGDSVALTLVFASGLELPVEAEVRPLVEE